MESFQNSLKVTICEDGKDAIRHGFVYRQPVFKPINIDQVVVVKNGTETQKATVDIVLVDSTGQKYVVMMTAALLASIPLE